MADRVGQRLQRRNDPAPDAVPLPAAEQPVGRLPGPVLLRLAAGEKPTLASKGAGGAQCTPTGERRPRGSTRPRPGRRPRGRRRCARRPSPRRSRHHAGRSAGTAAHLRLAAQYLGWRAPTTLELKELDEFLLARAVEHDSPTLLFRPVIHNTGQNSPLVGPGAVGCSSKSRPQQPRANDERRDSSRSAAGGTLRG
jgi:hypothetical protein